MEKKEIKLTYQNENKYTSIPMDEKSSFVRNVTESLANQMTGMEYADTVEVTIKRI